MNTHDIETVLRSFLTGDGYIAADDIPAICAAIEADRQRRGEPVELDRYDAVLLGGQDGMPAYVWHDIIRAKLDRAYDFYMDQLDRAAPQPAELANSVEPVSAPKHLIERLQKHCEDKSNTAFARSTMREALQYLTAEPCVSSVSDKTACGSASGDCDSQRAEPSSHSIQDCPEDDKWNCKYCKRVNKCPVVGQRDAQPATPVVKESLSVAESVNPNEEYKPEYKYCEDGKVVWTNAADAPVVKSAEPVKCPDPSMGEHACSNRAQCWEPCGELGSSIEHAKVAEPVKVPSDTDIDELSREWGLQSAAYPSKSMVRDFARDLLARYGQPAQPVVFTDANCEERFIEHEANSCPYCGGSGHKDDVESATNVEHVLAQFLIAHETGAPVTLAMADAARSALGAKVMGQLLAAPVSAQPSVPEKMESYGQTWEEVAYADGWNACRAAMLAAEQAQQDDPTPEEEEAWQRMEKTNE